MPKSKRTLFVAVADTHINSMMGLCPPYLPLDGGGSYHSSKPQKASWRAWTSFWDDRYRQAKAEKARLWVVFNGDIGDRNTHDGVYLISRNEADELRYVTNVLEPIAKRADAIFVIRGTEAHEGKGACIAEKAARDIDAIGDEETGTSSWWHLDLEVSGVNFDIQHHPETTGRRPWTKPAASARAATIIRERALDNGRRAPDIALRAHAHYDMPGPEKYRPFYVQMGPWQLTSTYGYRIGATGQIENLRGYWFLCDDGLKAWDVETYTPVQRRPLKEADVDRARARHK